MKSCINKKKIMSIILSIIMIFSIIYTDFSYADNFLTRVDGEYAGDINIKADNTDYSNHWAKDKINSAKQRGYISGYKDGTFKPNANITRAEFVSIVNRAFNYTKSGSISFNDVLENAWYKKDVSIAFNTGYISGISKDKFAPNDLLTREQASVIISKSQNMTDKDINLKFVDESSISSWAKDYVKSCVKYGVISGYENNTFRPKNPLTRAETVTIIEKILEKKNQKVEDKKEQKQEDKKEEKSEDRKEKKQEDKKEQKSDSGASGSGGGGGGGSGSSQANSNKSDNVAPKTDSEKTVPVINDEDKDGLDDEFEKSIGTDPNKSDTDGDGLTDFEEINVSNPLVADENEDLDGDGLSNYDEIKKYNTLAMYKDTDFDELSDYDEVMKYKTNPNECDTDKDNIFDGTEILKGLDPLVSNKGHNIALNVKEDKLENISDFSLDIDVPAEEIERVSVRGLNKNTDKNLTSLDGYISGVDINVSKFNSAKMTFTLPKNMKIIDKKLQTITKKLQTTTNPILSASNNERFKSNLSSDMNNITDKKVQTTTDTVLSTTTDSVLEVYPVLFYFNEDTNRLEKVKDQVLDLTNGTITVNPTHFSKYIILDMNKQKSNINTLPIFFGKNGMNIVFALDSSGSMSSNDKDLLRVTASKEFVDKINNKTRIAVVKLGSYATILQGLTNDKAKVKEALDKINNYEGTNIKASLEKSLEEIRNNGNNIESIIVLFTDGQDYAGINSYENIIKECNEKNIKIYTFGLGKGVKEDILKEIANKTGGQYYFLKDASQIEKEFGDELNKDIQKEITQETEITDYILALASDLSQNDLSAHIGKTVKELIDTGVIDKRFEPLSNFNIDSKKIEYNMCPVNPYVEDKFRKKYIQNLYLIKLYDNYGNIIYLNSEMRDVSNQIISNFELKPMNNDLTNNEMINDPTSPGISVRSLMISDEKIRLAYNEYKRITNIYPENDIYMSGYSLGGSLARIVLYNAVKDKIKLPKKTITFSEYGCYYYKGGLYYSISPMDNRKYDHLDNKIKNIINNHNLLYNYYIKGISRNRIQNLGIDIYILNRNSISDSNIMRQFDILSKKDELNYKYFGFPTTVYNNDLALKGAYFSEDIEKNINQLEKNLNDLGIYNVENYYTKEYIIEKNSEYAIGYKTYTINGEKNVLIAIVARGTKNISEVIGDVIKGGEVDFIGEKIFHNIYDFQDKIWKNLKEYINYNYDIKTADNIKIFVTGHSLGGAATNALSARLNKPEENKELFENCKDKTVTKDDIYAYTYGAITVLNENKNIYNGNENIFNIYHYYDTFGPNGKLEINILNVKTLKFEVSHPLAKFGKTIEYKIESLYIKSDKEDISNPINHNMPNYIDFLKKKNSIRLYNIMSRDGSYELYSDLYSN